MVARSLSIASPIALILCFCFLNYAAPLQARVEGGFTRWDEIYDIAHSADDRITPGSLSAAPDGSAVAIARQGQIEVLDRSGKILAIEAGEFPAVAPDGKAIAFWSERSGARQLWVRRLDQQAATRMTDFAGGISPPLSGYDLYDSRDLQRISWNENSSKITFAGLPNPGSASPSASSQSDLAQVYRSTDGYPDPSASLAGDASFYFQDARFMSRIFILDISMRSTHSLTSPEDNFVSPSWSPSSEEIVAIRRGHSPDVILRERPRLEILKLSGQQLMLGESGYINQPTFSPDGRSVAYTIRGTFLGFSHLEVVEIQSGMTTPIDGEYSTEAGGFGWITPQRLVSVQRDGLGTRLLFSALVQGRAESRIVALDSRVLDLSAASGGGFMVIDDPKSPSRLSYFEPSGKLSTVMSITPQEGLIRPNYVPLSWRNANGETLSAMLLLPKSSHVRPRLIVDTYPGIASWGYNEDSYRSTAYLLTAGYAVLLVNARAPHAPDRAISSATFTSKAWGAAGLATMVSDFEGAIEAARRTGLVAANPVGAFGHSNGGGALAQLITLSPIVSCAVIQSPAGADYQEMFLSTPAWRLVSAWLGGATPWSDPRLYNYMSVYGRLSAIRGKTLLVGGDRDEPSMTASLRSMFNGMRAAGKDVELIIYPQEGHVLGKRATVDMWDRSTSFLDSCTSEKVP